MFLGIDWKARIKSKTFWVTFVPALLLLIQMALKIFGIEWNYDLINANLLDFINSAFALLAILGVAVDTSTLGISDKKE